MVCESFEYIRLGKVRFIDINASHTNEEWDDLWVRSGEFMPALEALAVKYGTEITDDCSFLHHNGNEVDTEKTTFGWDDFQSRYACARGYDYYDAKDIHSIPKHQNRNLLFWSRSFQSMGKGY